MKATRERITSLQKRYEPDRVARHAAAYNFAAGLCRRKRVLDIGCGDGYGSAILSRSAKEVVGMDRDPRAVAYAQKTHRLKNTRFVRAAASTLPGDAPYDVIVALQLIEHIENPDMFLAEVINCLKPGGKAIFTTPNRLLRLRTGQKPWNLHHCTEYSPSTLKRILARHFKKVSIHGITAIDPIYSFEKRKLALRRRIADIDFFRLYPRLPIRYALYALALLRSLHTSKNVRVSDAPGETFYVTKKNLNRCIDIAAVCQA